MADTLSSKPELYWGDLVAGPVVPPYLRVAEELRARIESGELTPGTRLPSLADLRRTHGHSQIVGQRAYKVLVEDGLVISKPGDGFFVKSREQAPLLIRHGARIAPASPAATDAVEQGVALTWTHHSGTMAADESVAARLGIEVGKPVMHTEYVYKAGGTPVQLAHSWEPTSITGPELIVLPEVGPYAGIGVAARMKAIGIEVSEPVERVRARGATRIEAEMLGLTPGAPVLTVQRTYQDAKSGRAVETAELVLTGDRWEVVYGEPTD